MVGPTGKFTACVDNASLRLARSSGTIRVPQIGLDPFGVSNGQALTLKAGPYTAGVFGAGVSVGIGPMVSVEAATGRLLLLCIRAGRLLLRPGNYW